MNKRDKSTAYTSTREKWTYTPGKKIPLAPLNLEAIKKLIFESSSDESEDGKTLPLTSDPSRKKNVLQKLSSNKNEPKDSLKSTTIGENKENIIKSTNGKAEADCSFDLDLSKLSLSTSVRKIEANFTPKINIIRSLKTPNKSQRRYGTPCSIMTPLLLPEKSLIYRSKDGFNKILVNNFEYVVHNKLGKGGSSDVYCGFNPLDKIYVAIKLVSLSNPITTPSYINEVKLLESLQHCDRIIKMYEYEIKDDKLIIVLEKGGSDLSTTIKQLAAKETKLPTHTLLFYWMELLYSVREIHANGVVHSDLKPANFLKSEFGLKLIDFGIANKVQEDRTCIYKSYQEGTCNYISPEALILQTSSNADSPCYGNPKYKIHFKSDIWSLGCILYQLVYQKAPFYYIKQIRARLAAITNPEHKISYPEAEWASPTIIKTLKRCLQYDIKLRPSVDDLIQEYEDVLKKI